MDPGTYGRLVERGGYATGGILGPAQVLSPGVCEFTLVAPSEPGLYEFVYPKRGVVIDEMKRLG